MTDNTTSGSTLRDLLCSVDPASAAGYADHDPAQLRREAQQIRRATRTPFRPPAHRRRAAVIAAASVAVVAAGGSAAAWVAATRPSDPFSGYCSPAVTLDREVWAHRGFAVAEGSDGSRSVPDALEVCATMWSTGIVTGGEPRQPGSTTVPELTACVIDDTLVVFPAGAGVCRQFGLPALRR
ncbi:hypothetical protein [Terrabacter sp. RAF57]|uniref:hypothetical protein n=1 Tax=Terrabacter sp. RAF57 TaxID=3233063 RepID=UPI003F9BE687